MHERFNVLGVGVSAINMEMATATIDRWIRDRQCRYVTITGVHGVMESQLDPEIRRIHNAAGMVTPDGMPLVWLGRHHHHEYVTRVYGPDLMLAVCQLSQAKGYRHFFYGGDEGVPELLEAKLKERFPKLEVVGTHSPPFRALSEEEDEAICQAIRRVRPDIVWVGLSTPKQERWMAEHVERLGIPVLVGVGAAFDFHSGLKKQAPSWMQRNGLEWFFRLLTEPRRLWKRYARNNPVFVYLTLLQMLGVKRYREEW